MLREPIPRSPGVRRLAIRVEDHDPAFGSFQGKLPRGQYGAGHIRIWDKGTYAASRWDGNRITFLIRGGKVSATCTLIRFTRGDSDRWLQFRHQD